MGRRFVDARRRDPYYRAAQRDGLRSRAAFKLAELAQKSRLFRRGDWVLDLGAAPGGWSIVAAEFVGASGRVIAVDPRPVDPIPGVVYVRGRVGDPGVLERIGEAPFDVVLSDMSPQISGAYATDHARSIELVRLGVDLARRVLRPGGSYVAKVFAGDLLDELRSDLEIDFARVRLTKPAASRGSSSEMYLLATGFGRGTRAARQDASIGSDAP